MVVLIIVYYSNTTFIHENEGLYGIKASNRYGMIVEAEYDSIKQYTYLPEESDIDLYLMWGDSTFHIANIDGDIIQRYDGNNPSPKEIDSLLTVIFE